MIRTRTISLVASMVAVTVVGVTAGSARAEPEHVEPQGPAKVAFGASFPQLADHEWGFPLGGFGGITPGAPLTHAPVIFVHGNTVDAADWYPVRDDFRAAGWSDQELWALSYNGLGSNNGTALTRLNPERDAEHQEMGWDGQARLTNNEVNVPDLYDFILAVRSYTGSDDFSLVTHSLGATLARRTLKLHPELRDDLVAFVGIAGANHGTSLCPPGSEGNVASCEEIAKDTEWLAELNGVEGADETYGPAKWLTIYDGSGGSDPAFAGPDYAKSPQLRGAENREFAGTYHNDLRLDAAIVTAYRTFVETADGGRGPEASPPRPTGATPDTPPAYRPPPQPGVFSNVGGFMAPKVLAEPAIAVGDVDVSTPAVPEADADAPDRFGTVSVSTIGRNWSGAHNAVMTLLLVAGLSLLALDRRRRAATR